LKEPHKPVNICLVGKYVELEDSYYSVREALKHAALFSHDRDLKLTWIPAEQLEKMDDIDSFLRNAQGIVVPGGFGNRGIEGNDKNCQICPRA
jgi:CTP synthase